MRLLLQNILLRLLPLLALATPAAAQGSPPVLWEGAAGQRALAALLAGPTGRAAAGARGSTKAVAGVSLPFVRNPAVTRRAEALTVQQVKATSETAATQLAQLFASRDVLAAWGQAMRQYGLGLDNVADAMTANWLVLYLSANELAEPPTAAQVAGLRRQLRRVCAQPGIAGKLRTGAQRQQLADYLHLQSLLLNQAQSGAETAHDAAASATLAQRAREVAKRNMGFDPTTVTLTAQGLLRK